MAYKVHRSCLKYRFEKKKTCYQNSKLRQLKDCSDPKFFPLPSFSMIFRHTPACKKKWIENTYPPEASTQDDESFSPKWEKPKRKLKKDWRRRWRRRLADADGVFSLLNNNRLYWPQLGWNESQFWHLVLDSNRALVPCGSLFRLPWS